MTVPQNPADQQPGNAQASLSGLPDAPELLKVRILPAQFARALGVSKQSVSRWLKDGWVCLGADGRLDPAVAIGQLLRRCDPGRLRARWLRQAVGEVQDLRDNLVIAEDRATAAEAALREARDSIAHLERWIADGDAHEERFRELLIERAETLRATPPEAWAETIADLSDAALGWGTDPAEPGDAMEDADLYALGADLDALDADLDALDAEATQAARELSNPEGGRGE